MKRQQSEPVNLNLKALVLARALTETLNLSSYQEKILGVLLAAPRPLKVSEINNFCKVPRTKIYGKLKQLEAAGLVILLRRTEGDVERPPIYEYWPDKKRAQWSTLNNIGVLYIAPNLPYLKDLHVTWSTEFYSRKLRIGQLLDILEEQSQEPPIQEAEL